MLIGYSSCHGLNEDKMNPLGDFTVRVVSACCI